MQVSVHVELDGRAVLAGSLFTHRRRGAESAAFAYDSAYLARRDAYAIDPELPLDSSPHQTRAGSALYGALGDTAPDRWGRTLVQRREGALAKAEGRAPRSLGEVDYLLGVRDDLRQGALRFRVGDGPFLAEEDSGVPALTDLPELLDLAARAEADTADLPDLLRLLRVGSSLGGARPKAHVQLLDGRVAMAKFPSARTDSWDVMAWERVALDLARQAGIDVANSQLLRLAGRSVLVVDRFDRRPDGSRIGYQSAMTVLEAADGNQRSYLELAEAVETRSARAGAELEQLWRRMAFSVLISNTDDHLRNHGMLHEQGDVWRLAPAFDLNPDPDPTSVHLSTAIDLTDDAKSVPLVLSVAPYFRLDGTAARRVLAEVVHAVSRWPAVARSHGLDQRQRSAMAPAFAALDQLPA